MFHVDGWTLAFALNKFLTNDKVTPVRWACIYKPKKSEKNNKFHDPIPERYLSQRLKSAHRGRALYG